MKRTAGVHRGLKEIVFLGRGPEGKAGEEGKGFGFYEKRTLGVCGNSPLCCWKECMLIRRAFLEQKTLRVQGRRIVVEKKLNTHQGGRTKASSTPQNSHLEGQSER